MSLEQRDHFEALREKTPESEAFYERARAVTPLGVESNIRSMDPYPFYVDRAEGSHLYDIDGNEYLDFLMGLGPYVLGHRHPDVEAAVKAQVERCEGVTAMPSPVAIEYMEKVRDMTPSIETVRLANSGSEATMHALRVARSYTGKDKVAKPEGGYAGAHDYALQSVFADEESLGAAERPTTVPYGKGIPDAVRDSVVAFPFNDRENTEAVLREHADDLAAVIIEPVLASCGVLPPAPGYHEFLRELTEELGIVLLWDEVMTGFRLGPGSAQGRFDVTPDMTAFAKVAGGGYQMAGFGGKREIMSVIEPPEGQPGWREGTFHGGTYNGSPVSCAAGLKTLELIEDGQVFERIEGLADQLFGGLEAVAEEAGVGVNVQQVGSMGQVFMTDRELTRYRDTWHADEELFMDWWLEAAAGGALFGNHEQTERFFTADSHTEAQIDRGLEIAEDAFRAVAD